MLDLIERCMYYMCIVFNGTQSRAIPRLRYIYCLGQVFCCMEMLLEYLEYSVKADHDDLEDSSLYKTLVCAFSSLIITSIFNTFVENFHVLYYYE